ncbi:MAG: scyllo-inositol 2-dehydrogenase (NADP+) [Candidatus Latescibacterota bacterium]|jgi:scyllo-inositol 2-dehydrogenase (NADP+)
MAKQKRIRVGVLGQGRSGLDIHCAWFRKSKAKFEIVAVSDILKDRRERAEKELGCVAYADYHDLLKRDDLDLVVNSLPSHLHPKGTMEILKAGHNVVCEKPMAPTVKELKQVIAVSKKAGKIYAPFQQSRNAPAFQQMKKVIDSGVLGRAVMVKIAYNGYARRWDWQTLQEFSAGNLYNTGPHPMDQAMCLFDWKMPEVTCVMDRTNTYGDAEDHVKILMTRKGAPTIDMEISSCSAYSGDMYQVYGTLGGLTGGPSGMKWRYFNPKKNEKQELIRTPLPGPSYCREGLEFTEKTWVPNAKQKDTFTYMSKAFYDHIYKVLTEGAPLVMTPEQVIPQIAVMEECHRQNPLKKLKAKGWPKGN